MEQEKQWGLAGYEPTGLDQFLWWLSTAEPELIKDCAVDRNRYRITGVIVLCTWLFATLAWGYFFSTTNTNVLAYCLLGAFMGFIVLSIDRALIKGINRRNKSKLGPLLFRGVLALTIGFFMAQPAVLYLFDQEVRLQANVDNEARRTAKRQQLATAYAPQLAAVQQARQGMDSVLANRMAAVDAARNNYLSEADGSGGTGKVGISTIALAKKQEYEQLAQQYQQEKLQVQPRLDSLTRAEAALKDTMRVQEERYAALLNLGFLTRIEAMENLIAENRAVATRYYLIVAILMLIELMPVIAKSMLPDGPYQQRIALTEANEQERYQRNLGYANHMSDYYNQRLSEADREAIDQFFTQSKAAREAKLEEAVANWQADSFTSFDGFWRKMKRNWMGRLE